MFFIITNTNYQAFIENKNLITIKELKLEIESYEEQDNKINVNDSVKIKSLNKVGIVTSIKGSKATIESNNNKMIVSLSELEKINVVKNNTKKTVKVNSVDSLAKSVPMSANLIGMRVDEALIQLRNYLDAALLVRYPQVTIIHGFGTGALRKAVHEYLKSSKYVVEYRLGGFNEGGAGATIVVLKKK